VGTLYTRSKFPQQKNSTSFHLVANELQLADQAQSDCVPDTAVPVWPQGRERSRRRIDLQDRTSALPAPVEEVHEKHQRRRHKEDQSPRKKLRGETGEKGEDRRPHTARRDDDRRS
jgi:hypothetical protein